MHRTAAAIWGGSTPAPVYTDAEMKAAEKEVAQDKAVVDIPAPTTADVNEWISKQVIGGCYKVKRKRGFYVPTREKELTEKVKALGVDGIADILANENGDAKVFDGVSVADVRALNWFDLLDRAILDQNLNDPVTIKAEIQKHLGEKQGGEITFKVITDGIDRYGQMPSVERPTDTWTKDGDEMSTPNDFWRGYLNWTKTKFPYGLGVRQVVSVATAGAKSPYQRLLGLQAKAAPAAMIAILYGAKLSNRALAKQSNFGSPKAVVIGADGGWYNIDGIHMVNMFDLDELNDLRGVLPWIWGMVGGVGMGQATEGTYITAEGLGKNRRTFFNRITQGMVTPNAMKRRPAAIDKLAKDARRLDTEMRNNKAQSAKMVMAYLKPVVSRLRHATVFAGDRDDNDE